MLDAPTGSAPKAGPCHSRNVPPTPLGPSYSLSYAKVAPWQPTGRLPPSSQGYWHFFRRCAAKNLVASEVISGRICRVLMPKWKSQKKIVNVAIIGTGYVGLITGACLAFLGHKVSCVDADASKIAALSRGEVPFYEPHLEALLEHAKRNLSFTGDYCEAIPDAQVIFIAVGTLRAPAARRT